MLRTLPSIVSATKSGCFIIIFDRGESWRKLCVQIVTPAKIILEPGSDEGCVIWGGRGREGKGGSRRSGSPKAMQNTSSDVTPLSILYRDEASTETPLYLCARSDCTPSFPRIQMEMGEKRKFSLNPGLISEFNLPVPNRPSWHQCLIHTKP